MNAPSVIALAGFIAWALLLLLLMEAMRVSLVLRGKLQATAFTPDNAGLSPFMQRLARAHGNCVEGLPVFGGLLLVAIATGTTQVTDPLAPVLLASRVLQSLVHLISVGPVAVNLRFAAFCVQLAIGAYWTVALLMALG